MKFLKAVLFIVFVFAALAVHAQSSADLKRQRDELTRQLDQLNQEYDQTVNNKKATLKQLNLLKEKINLREEKINNINSEIRNLDNQIAESNSSVHNLQSQLSQLKKEYAAMVLFTYYNQSSYNKLMFIFAAKDFNQAYKRLKYLQQIGTYRERQAGYIQETQVELHVKINELDKNKKEKSTLLVDQLKEKESLGKEKETQVQVVADLSKHEGLLKQQQQDIQRKIAKTNKAINTAIRREIEEAKRKAEEEERARQREAAARAKAENKEAPVVKPRTAVKNLSNSEVLNATPEAARLSNDFLQNRGSLPWPVSTGSLKQGFGIYYDNEGIKNESYGWDIKTNQGASVRAVFNGEVTHISDVSGTYLVIIKHGEYFTAYSNLRSYNVKQGQKVTTKQVIGVVSTESSTGEAIVNFAIYKGLDPVNPKIWLVPN
ncbi:murein hydrolase activator EnvC family protein [Mucilaginibacter gotjawali]|uniref:Septal ring factor EnvC (AmiA/AmiB activator) n=2 Tax=Mucilaginibacter gotjawali TaxID=1550579 RepID=A0A839SD58_9SPHI|nr:peptidoglycan DD-metalloendopeptidase family protein [Mucilaginibacter gotjawali]MBB3055242.1 septal ring factor EnvC (AmiA/AmiB activator) [Mucilaginibacter gotjawali]BAU56139.1 Murein hydrolase activator EnvC precursor [Mucilaginibacter gotjawali]